MRPSARVRHRPARGPIVAVAAARRSRILAASVAVSLSAVIVSAAGAVGPYWHVDTFNAANLSAGMPNHAMWSGVPSGTPGYATAPGYGNGWNDQLYWRTTVADPSQPTVVRLRFVYNYDTQPSLDFFRAEWQDGAAWTSLLQTSGSNKVPPGVFTTPATFDQLWTIGPGHYGGPLGNQVVLRLRVTSSASGSDEDGGYNTSGAVQVDNVVVELDGNPVSTADFESTGGSGGWTPYDRQAVAEYVRDNVLGGQYGGVTMAIPETPLDPSYVARDPGDLQIPDLPLPYAQAWLVTIDDYPIKNWGHPCRWVAVRADLMAHAGPLSKSFPAVILANGGAGPSVSVGCGPFTPNACPSLETPPSEPLPGVGIDDPCLFAVLVSGGWKEGENHEDYKINLREVYRILRAIGYARSNIFVYYAVGEPLDLDDLDGDGDHATGSEVDGPADQALIRAKIQDLCAELDPRKDVLFIYGTNHGNSLGLVLWDADDDAFRDDGDVYTPAELASDTRDCRACRVFVTMDVCYSGVFIPIATDGNHANMALYTSCTDAEETNARAYCDLWDGFDFAERTMNYVHDHIAPNWAFIGGHPQKAEGTPGNGDIWLNYCWGAETCHVPWDSPLCLGESFVEVEVEICNNLDDDHSYDLAFAGDPAGSPGDPGECNIDGPETFTVLDPLPVLVPSGDCARVRVRIDRPAGMAAVNDQGCYTVKATNVERGNALHCRGSLWDRRDLCAEWERAAGVIYLPPGATRRVTLDLENIESTLSVLPYEIEVMPSDMMGPNEVVSLNGLPPGTPVTGLLTLPPPGNSTQLSVDVSYAQPDPDFFYDLMFRADVTGTLAKVTEARSGAAEAGQRAAGPLLPLTSVGLRWRSNAASAPLPQERGARLGVQPNPSFGVVEISFAIEGSADAPVSLDLLDLQGRVVRSLVRGQAMSPGPHRIEGVTLGGLGDRLSPGVYFIRLVTLRGQDTAPVVVLE